MPVTVVVGGQFGSEGKGKVAFCLARSKGAAASVRVGGSNSGHTVVLPDGKRYVLRHLPTASLLPGINCFIGPGAYIDVDVLEAELQLTRLEPRYLHIDPNASVITSAQKRRECSRKIGDRIGSTETGTGEAVSDRVRRNCRVMLAKDEPRLKSFTKKGPIRTALRTLLDQNKKIIVEGTQGFGLSVLHSEDYPKATSRDTTAAGFLAEAALSPRDVDSIVLVLRAFPIRVPGNSGPLPNETTWEAISRRGAWDKNALHEYTSVTHRERRVADFDAAVVRAAIEVNSPDTIVLNHIDYCDAAAAKLGQVGELGCQKILEVESLIGRKLNFIGLGPDRIAPRSDSRPNCIPYKEVAG